MTYRAKITLGVPPAQHVVIMGLGIGKVYEKTFIEDEVELVVSAAWEGRGRSGETYAR